MVIVALFILVGLGYFCFKVGIFDEMFNKTKQTEEAKKQTTEEKTNIESREVIMVRHILEARDRFLKDKAEKGENFRYESYFEKLYRKQKFNPQFHCEIPDDIKIIYDKMLDIISEDNSINVIKDDSDVKRFKNEDDIINHKIKKNGITDLFYTYDRTYSKKIPVWHLPSSKIQAINLWSKEQMIYKNKERNEYVEIFNKDCKN